MRILFVVLLILTGSVSFGRTWYLSPDGSDSNPGTISQPFFSLTKVWPVLLAGDTVLLRGGTYHFSSTQYLVNKKGTATNTIKIWAYPGEIPVITRNTTTSFKDNWQSGICFIGDYFHWKGLEITGFTQLESKVYTGFRVSDSNNNVFEKINSHHNGHGFTISGKSTGNLVLNCDFHHNQDPLTEPKYEDADGLEICYIPAGMTNTIKGCRFWWNTDDGLDLWENDGIVLIDSCWSWNNGFVPGTNTPAGNGNGFKLGITTVNHGTNVLRTLKNCLAFNNRARGFDQNKALCSVVLSNTTAFKNGTSGFVFDYGGIIAVVKNSISYKNEIAPAFNAAAITAANSFRDNEYMPSPSPISDSDFLSLDGTQLEAPRKEDGSLPDINFMHLAPGSGLIDAGINVGLPFNGNAPDIGAFETPSQSVVIVNQPPVIRISSPLKSASFTSPASITIDAVATDPDGAIIKVEFFQGSVKIGEIVKAPYTISWKEVPAGTYSLTAVATDNGNLKTVSEAVSVTVIKSVTVVNQSPVISISAPTKGSEFTSPATITIDINASDPDGSITKVELFNGAIKLEERTSTPYTFTLKELPAGTYNLKAVATDNLRASSESSILQFRVVTINEKKEYFNLYPNPNNGRFTVDFSSLVETESFMLTVVDLIGNTVFREEISSDESTRQFDLSHLNSGIYILMIAAGQILLTQKLILNQLP